MAASSRATLEPLLGIGSIEQFTGRRISTTDKSTQTQGNRSTDNMTNWRPR
jgi:hypothetical protein